MAKEQARLAEEEERRRAAAAEPHRDAVPKPQRYAQPASQCPAEPERPTFKRPSATPGVRKEEPVHPKAVNYKEVSDDDFFGKFDPPTTAGKANADEDGPLTLDDIFGENGLFNDSRKGGKR